MGPEDSHNITCYEILIHTFFSNGPSAATQAQFPVKLLAALTCFTNSENTKFTVLLVSSEAFIFTPRHVYESQIYSLNNHFNHQRTRPVFLHTFMTVSHIIRLQMSIV